MNSVRKTQLLATASLLTVFALDVNTPTKFVFDILYLCSILIVFKQSTQTIIIFSVAACMLILINILIANHTSKLNLSVWTNRGISMLAIFITSYLAIHYRKLSEARAVNQKQYLKALEGMLFIISHQVRKPVANILGLVDLINTNPNLSSDDFQKYCKYLHSSANELDGFLKELNSFIEQTEQKQGKV